MDESEFGPSFCTRPYTDDQKALLRAIADDPLNQLRRDVYSDWLLDRDEIEEADRQRQWIVAFRHLYKFTRTWDEEKFELFYDDQLGDFIKDEVALAAGLDESFNRNSSAVCDHLEFWLESLKETEPGIHFGADWPADELRGFFGDEVEKREQFFRALETVSGTRIPSEVKAKAYIRCAC